MGKKEWLYVYVELIRFAVHLKLIQCCKSTIPLKILKNEKKLWHSVFFFVFSFIVDVQRTTHIYYVQLDKFGHLKHL